MASLLHHPCILHDASNQSLGILSHFLFSDEARTSSPVGTVVRTWSIKRRLFPSGAWFSKLFKVKESKVPSAERVRRNCTTELSAKLLTDTRSMPRSVIMLEASSIHERRRFWKSAQVLAKSFQYIRKWRLSFGSEGLATQLFYVFQGRKFPFRTG